MGSGWKFIQDLTDFIFVEHAPEQADIIFVPGGRSGEIAVTAARLWRIKFNRKVWFSM